jgi:hypothetical protein
MSAVTNGPVIATKALFWEAVAEDFNNDGNLDVRNWII